MCVFLSISVTAFGSWQLLLSACNQFTAILMTIDSIAPPIRSRYSHIHCTAYTRDYFRPVLKNANPSVTFNFIWVNQSVAYVTATRRARRFHFCPEYLITHSHCFGSAKTPHELEFHKIMQTQSLTQIGCWLLFFSPLLSVHFRYFESNDPILFVWIRVCNERKKRKKKPQTFHTGWNVYDWYIYQSAYERAHTRPKSQHSVQQIN